MSTGPEGPEGPEGPPGPGVPGVPGIPPEAEDDAGSQPGAPLGDLPEYEYEYPAEYPARAGPPPSRVRAGSRRRARQRHPWRVVVLGVVALVVVVLLGGFLWVQHEASPGGPPGAQVIATVRSGTGTSQLASVLEAKGVIGSSFAYRIWSQFHGSPSVLPGSYAFPKNSSFASVNRIIGAGPNVYPIEIPPGFTVSEVATQVGELPGHTAAGFSALATGGTVRSPWEPAGSTNLDGLLGTGQYIVVPGETDTQLLTTMIDRFDRLADSLDIRAGAATLGLTPYQLITVASIVEKEGVIEKNLGPVARVIFNRLANDMPLQMDSTILYSEGRDGGPVTPADLAIHSPYNTYLNKGLTPTPICFPSKASLKAALDPPAGSWLFFVVVQKDGTEAFADTFAEQQQNEALAQQRGVG